MDLEHLGPAGTPWFWRGPDPLLQTVITTSSTPGEAERRRLGVNQEHQTVGSWLSERWEGGKSLGPSVGQDGARAGGPVSSQQELLCPPASPPLSLDPRSQEGSVEVNTMSPVVCVASLLPAPHSDEACEEANHRLRASVTGPVGVWGLAGS